MPQLAQAHTMPGWLVILDRIKLLHLSLSFFPLKWGCTKGEPSCSRDSFSICLLECGHVVQVIDLCPSSTWCIVQDSAGLSLGTAAGKQQHAFLPQKQPSPVELEDYLKHTPLVASCIAEAHGS